MVERNAAMAAEAMDGRVIAGDPEIRWSGGAIDSRRVAGGEIYFALPGARVDGHDYVADVVGRGAATIVVHKDVAHKDVAHKDVAHKRQDVAWIRVADTFKALHALTHAVRATTPRKLVGLTGSAGKTTTKELLAVMLARRYRVEKSLGNFNNTYGFPLALLNIADGCDWMVAEMGMSTPGELGQVSRLGRPDVAVLLNVRPVHLENFGQVSAIADAKAELLDGLAPGGLIVANADDPQVTRVVERYVRERDPRARVLRYGFHSDGFHSDGLHSDPVDMRASPPVALGDGRVGSRFEVSTADESITLELPIHGLYNAENCLAAAACAHALGVSLEDIRVAVREIASASGRGEVHRLADDITLIDDSYNSNPDAVMKALESARSLPGKRFIAVLGDMLELGPGAPDYHRQVGVRAAELGFNPLVGVGDLARQILAGSGERGVYAAHFANAAQAAFGVPSMIRPGDVVLVKGSRGVALEAVVQAIRAAFPISSRGEKT